jgi:hypothetical protein
MVSLIVESPPVVGIQNYPAFSLGSHYDAIEAFWSGVQARARRRFLLRHLLYKRILVLRERASTTILVETMRKAETGEEVRENVKSVADPTSQFTEN